MNLKPNIGPFYNTWAESAIKKLHGLNQTETVIWRPYLSTKKFFGLCASVRILQTKKKGNN